MLPIPPIPVTPLPPEMQSPGAELVLQYRVWHNEKSLFFPLYVLKFKTIEKNFSFLILLTPLQ
jgi:hypothetical protein